MDATREIYWNIGHGIVPVMYLLAIAATGFMAKGFYDRYLLWRQGKDLNRFDNWPARLKILLSQTFSQERVIRVRDGGVFHALFFWAFLVLFAGTLTVMLQADLLTPLTSINILSGNFYRFFSLALDLAGLLAMIMLGGLFVRRFIFKPKGLETTSEDMLIHLLFFAIFLTGFMIEGARMAATELRTQPELALWSPVGYLFALLFSSFGDAFVLWLHKGMWFGHMLLALGFIVIIPRTKLRHIFTSSGNSYFVPRVPKVSLGTMNLEDETIEQFGVSTISDLTWKDIFDTDACISCKRCQDRCPAYRTEKPLSPMKLISTIKAVAADSEKDKSLVEAVTSDVLWSCTTCRACQEICPANIEHVHKILDMRRNLTLMEGAFPGDEVRVATGNVEVNGNPFGIAYVKRGEWAEGLPVKVMAEDSNVDILYFAGCYASFDKRNRKIAASFIRICDSAGVKVGILGKEEKCCGEPFRKLGNEYLFQTIAAENIEAIKAYKVKKIVVTCPHCFQALSKAYKDLKMTVPVEHYTVFISRLIAEKKLSLKKTDFSFTYHDSCFIGRYNDIFEEPRSILQSLGGKLTEMGSSHEESFCCGGGGGRILAEEKLGRRINVERVKMAKQTGESLLVSNCPFCITMFEDGIKTGGFEHDLKARDVAELVSEHLVEK